MSVRNGSIGRIRGDIQKGSGRQLFILWAFVIFTSASVNVYLAQYHAESIALEQARAMFEQIVLTRNWNAQHGGVYVPISETTQPNPYLKGEDRDLVTDGGTRLTKINPAYMTRQVAELAQQGSGVQFHITSLKPIRPQNAPLPWERAALERFELGEKEVGEFLPEGHKYRYMAPLVTTSACLKCHAVQGYKQGDIRGGISVTQPVEGILHNREHTIVNTFIIHFLVFVAGVAAIRSYLRSQQRLQALSVDKEGAVQANAFKGAFIANISHELRTPLNAIIGMSYILEGEAMTPAQRDYLQKISAAGKQLNTMVNHMLDFSRLDAGTMRLNLAPLRLHQLVQESAALMQEPAAKKGLTLTVDFDDGIPDWFLGDGQKIQQILFHLLDNAIKFTERGEVRVSVSAHREAGDFYSVTLSVADSGIGIERSPEWLEQHELSQIEDHHTRHQGGVGLGLTLSRRLLQLMGGRLRIKSEPGQGTLVTVELRMGLAAKPSHSETGTAGKALPPGAGETAEAAEEERALRKLEGVERQRLQQQLRQLLEYQESDFPRALESIAALIDEYQGTVYLQQLQLLSDKLSAFDSDGVIEVVHAMQQSLTQQKKTAGT